MRVDGVLVLVMIITDLETLLLLLQLLLLPLLLSVNTLPCEVWTPSARCAPSIR